MADPLVFISHKHSDKRIALEVARFIESEAPIKLRVFLSSDAGFEGIRVGRKISVELREALANADLFLLVFTSADEDWSWCMWELGVANHPLSKATNTIVLQCSSDSPRVDAGSRRVDCRKRDDIHAFVKQYFTEPGLFPSLGGRPLAEFHREEVVKEKAYKFFESISPLIDFVPSVEWSTWPYIQIELPHSSTILIKDVTKSLKITEQVELVKKSAKISAADSKALNLFGLTRLEPGGLFSQLEKIWMSESREPSAAWFDNSCEQIAIAAAEKLSQVPSVACRSVGGHDFYPVVTHVRSTTYEGAVRFDLYFVKLPSHSARSVVSKMLRPEHFYWKRFSDSRLPEMRLLALSEDLKSQGKNRLPFLDENDSVKYVIHRASIDEFIVGNLERASELTMLDLLKDDTMRSMMQRTLIVLPASATIEEARTKISGDIRDVFITQTGQQTEPVLGWLTNVDLGSEN